MLATKIRLPLCLLLVAAQSISAYAHAHDDDASEEQLNAPLDAILVLHIAVQALVWGVLFPIGMVLGLTRSRWHAPLQVSLSSAPSIPPSDELYLSRVSHSHSRLPVSSSDTRTGVDSFPIPSTAHSVPGSSSLSSPNSSSASISNYTFMKGRSDRTLFVHTGSSDAFGRYWDGFSACLASSC